MFTFMEREVLDRKWDKFRQVEKDKQSLKIVKGYGLEIVQRLETVENYGRLHISIKPS